MKKLLFSALLFVFQLNHAMEPVIEISAQDVWRDLFNNLDKKPYNDSVATTMSEQEQDEIRQSLYDNKIDFSSLDSEAIDTCIQIIKDHMLLLELDKQPDSLHAGACRDGLFGVGFLGTFLSRVLNDYICYMRSRNLLLPTTVCTFSDNKYKMETALVQKNYSYTIQSVKEFVLEKFPLVALDSLALVASLLFFKSAYDDLQKGRNVRENFIRDLAKDKKLLIKLEAIKL